MGKAKTMPLHMTELERLEMLNAQHKLDSVRAEAIKAKLTFELKQTRADLLIAQAELAKLQASTELRSISEAAAAAEKNELKNQRELADKLAEAYGVDWATSTWSPETGEFTTLS